MQPMRDWIWNWTRTWKDDVRGLLNVRTPVVPLGSEDARLQHLVEVRDRLNEVSPSFCLAKWLQVTLHLHNGHTHSCHHVKSHKVPAELLKKDPSVLHNTPFKLEQRRKMMKGSRPAECSYCWSFEDRGRLSDRHHKSSYEWAAPHFEKVLEAKARQPINPTSVEVSFENTCNFKCMYCSPQFSSSWMDEARKHGPYPTRSNDRSIAFLESEQRIPIPKDEYNPYIEAFWKWWPDLAGDLHDFRITGGEPLLSSHLGRVFDDLTARPRPQLHFAINSNMGVARRFVDSFIEKVNGLEGKVKTFTLYTSMDTMGAQAEYIRYGLNFEDFVANVHRVLSETKWPIHICYMITVNALSLPGYRKLMEMIFEQRLLFPQHQITTSSPCLRNPKCMSVEILTPDFKKYVEDTRDFMASTKGHEKAFSEAEIQQVDRILSLMAEQSMNHVELRLNRLDFYRMFREYDRRRQTDFGATFPEFQEFWSLCRAQEEF